MNNAELKRELEQTQARLAEIVRQAALATEELTDLAGRERDEIFSGIGAAKYHLIRINAIATASPAV